VGLIVPNPSHPLWAACSGDPALATTKPNSAEREALMAYIKGREIAQLAAVTLVPGQQPVLVELAPLSAKLRAAALGFPNEPQRRLVACQYAARKVMTAWTVEGTQVTGSAEELDATDGVLSEKGVARLQELVGGEGIEELGSLALQRATVHPRALSPFVLPSHSGGA
jgi:hypothetical protein